MKNDFSADIYRYQKLIDPLIISSIFCLINKTKINFFWKDTGYFFLVFIIVLYILNSEKVYINTKKINFLKSVEKVFYFSLIITLILFGFDSFLLKETIDLLKIGIFFISCNIYLYMSHSLLIQFFRKLKSKGWNNQNIIYFGGYKPAKEFYLQNKENNWIGYKFKAWFSPFEKDFSMNLDLQLNCSGGLNNIDDYMKKNKIDRIIFSTETDNQTDIRDVLFSLGKKSIPVTINPYWITKGMLIDKRFIGDSLCIDIWSSKLTMTDRFFKRLMDLMIAFLLLVLTSPILILTALFIRLSSRGPIIFSQARAGLSGNNFYINKFRSMNDTEPGDK